MERRRQLLRDNLLGFDIICNVTKIVDASLQESSTCKESRPPANNGHIDRSAEDVESRLIEKPMYDGKTPVIRMFESIHSRFEEMMVPGSEGEHGMAEFRKKNKNVDWGAFWAAK